MYQWYLRLKTTTGPYYNSTFTLLILRTRTNIYWWISFKSCSKKRILITYVQQRKTICQNIYNDLHCQLSACRIKGGNGLYDLLIYATFSTIQGQHTLFMRKLLCTLLFRLGNHKKLYLSLSMATKIVLGNQSFHFSYNENHRFKCSLALTFES